MPQDKILTQPLVEDDFDFENATVEEYEAMLRSRMAEGRDAARAASVGDADTKAYFDFYAEADELLIQFNVLCFKSDKAGNLPEHQQAKLLGATLGSSYGGYLKDANFMSGLVFQQSFQMSMEAAINGVVPEGAIAVEAKNGKGN